MSLTGFLTGEPRAQLETEQLAVVGQLEAFDGGFAEVHRLERSRIEHDELGDVILEISGAELLAPIRYSAPTSQLVPSSGYRLGLPNPGKYRSEKVGAWNALPAFARSPSPASRASA